MSPSLRANFSTHSLSAISFVHLWNQAQNAVRDQGRILGSLEFIQYTVDKVIASSWNYFFTNYIEPQPYYFSAKEICIILYESIKEKAYRVLFPNTETLILYCTYTSNLGDFITRNVQLFRKEKFLELKTYVIAATSILGTATYFGLLNPVNFFILYGSTLFIALNRTGLQTLGEDLKNNAEIIKSLLENYLAIFNRFLSESNETSPPTEESPVITELRIAFGFLTKLLHRIKERAPNFKEMIKEKLSSLEIEQRKWVFSKILDNSLWNAATLMGSFMKTNLTGLTTAAVFFYATYLFANNQNCSLLTPLAYSWNNTLLLGSIFKFSEACNRYRTFMNLSNIVKWSLRFFIFHKMIHVWQESRREGYSEFVNAFKRWGYEKTTSLFHSLPTIQIPTFITNAILSIRSLYAVNESNEPIDLNLSLARREVQHIQSFY